MSVLIYNRRNGQWEKKTYGDVKVDTEFIVGNRLYTTTKNGYILVKPEVDTSQLVAVDRFFNPDNWDVPNPNNVVFLLKSSSNQQKGHWLLKDIQPDSEVVFQGKVWSWTVDAKSQQFLAEDTGNVFAEVTATHQEVHEDDVLALTVHYELCGKFGFITGSEEHPFYVLDREDYIPMVELLPGMELKTDRGTRATVVELKPLPITLELYNLTVKDVHNYYIFLSEDIPGVLVHNIDCDFVTRAIDGGLPNRGGTGKTSGYLFDSDGNMIEDMFVSGQKAPYYPDRTLVRGDDKLYSIQSHVEAQIAGFMRDNNITNATLVLNNHPCSNVYGCHELLEKMLPEGATLRIIVPEGFDSDGAFDLLYTGIAVGD